jgi:hypothetical protein
VSAKDKLESEVKALRKAKEDTDKQLSEANEAKAKVIAELEGRLRI